MRKNRKLIYALILFTGDLLLYYFSFRFSYFIRFDWQPFTEIFPPIKGIPAWSLYLNFFKFSIIIWFVSLLLTAFYKKNSLPAMDEFVGVVKVTSLTTLLLMATTFLYRGAEFSRFAIAMIWITSTVFIYSWHELFKITFQTLLIRTRNALVVGNSENIAFIKKMLKKNRHIKPFFIVGVESIDRIMEFMDEKGIDEAYMNSSMFKNKEEFLKFIDCCELRKVEIKIVSDILQMSLGETMIDDSLGLPVFVMKPISLTGMNFYYKRIFDILISIILLSVTSPIIIFAVLLIKLNSPGPILYLHKRVGYKGTAFNFFKLRTMVKDADSLLEKIKHLSERSGPVFKMKDDPRMTKFGKFLRRYSVDELPQLINVLRGDMSIVGPRPQVLWEATAYDNYAKKRLRIMPGITGLWQVSGRASLSYEEMINLDIYYIENWSPGLDLKIISRTLPAIFSKKGAY